MKTWEDVSVGDSFGPISYRVSSDIATKFRRVTRADHPWYTTESPYGAPIVPSTLPSGDDFPLIGTEMDTGVHAKHSLRLFQPLRIDEEAIVEGTVVDKYVKRGNRFLVFRYTLRNSSGNLLCENIITFALMGEE